MASMTTVTLQQAMESLGALPADIQDELAAQLIAYAEQWQELRGGIAEAKAEIDRGEITEITSIDGFVDNLSKGNGRS